MTDCRCLAGRCKEAACVHAGAHWRLDGICAHILGKQFPFTANCLSHLNLERLTSQAPRFKNSSKSFSAAHACLTKRCCLQEASLTGRVWRRLAGCLGRIPANPFVIEATSWKTCVSLAVA